MYLLLITFSGDRVLYIPPRSDRRGPPRPADVRVGSIVMFYLLEEDGERASRQELFVELVDHPVIGKYRSLHIVDNPGAMLKEGFKVEPRPNIGSAQNYYHIDAIKAKAFLAPHFDITLRDTQMCAIEMFSAR